ncbi:MAG: uroporphyrinogen decarboxylase family protein [Candidatus Omnitrophota bacterium]
MVPVRKSGLNYIEFFWREKRNLNKTRCDVERAFGSDVFLHSCEGPSPKDPETSTESIHESDDEVVYTEILHTKRGNLESIKKITRTESIATVKGFVQDPQQDRDKILELLKNPDSKDFTPYISDWRYVGDLGHCGFWLPTPVDWWSLLRRSPEVAIYDFVDYPHLIADFFKEYTNYAVAMTRRLLKNHRLMVDSIGLGGSTTSMSVISPKYLKEYIVGFVQAITAEARIYDIPVQYHMCGRSRHAIPILVEAGINGMDALERPSTGDVDLGEVKRLFGNRISLRGNVNSIETMLQGKPKDVENEVLRCMQDAKRGGGFILGVGDQTPYWTPDENIVALVEAGRRYGTY